jgi:hypothetical protein
MDYSGGDAPEQLALSRLDTAAAEFMSVSRHLEALECMEKALAIRVRLFGAKSTEVRIRSGRCFVSAGAGTAAVYIAIR